jgi:transposase
VTHARAAELLRLNSLPESYMPSPDIEVLREKVRRRAFLVRQRTKLKVKIRGVLTYEGVRPPEGYGLYTRKGRQWPEGLGMESIHCYLRVIETLGEEIRRLSLELRHIVRTLSTGWTGTTAGSRACYELVFIVEHRPAI